MGRDKRLSQRDRGFVKPTRSRVRSLAHQSVAPLPTPPPPPPPHSHPLLAAPLPARTSLAAILAMMSRSVLTVSSNLALAAFISFSKSVLSSFLLFCRLVRLAS